MGAVVAKLIIAWVFRVGIPAITIKGVDRVTYKVISIPKNKVLKIRMPRINTCVDNGDSGIGARRIPSY